MNGGPNAERYLMTENAHQDCSYTTTCREINFSSKGERILTLPIQMSPLYRKLTLATMCYEVSYMYLCRCTQFAYMRPCQNVFGRQNCQMDVCTLTERVQSSCGTKGVNWRCIISGVGIEVRAWFGWKCRMALGETRPGILPMLMAR